MKYFRFFIILFIVLWVGAAIPHYVSSRGFFLGVLKKGVGGHLYVDKEVRVDAKLSDLQTINFLFHENNTLGAAGQDLITQRIKVTDVSNRAEKQLGEGCGEMKAKLYTFFNIKFGEATYGKHCP